jgi:hypothetical protein
MHAAAVTDGSLTLLAVDQQDMTLLTTLEKIVCRISRRWRPAAFQHICSAVFARCVKIESRPHQYQSKAFIGEPPVQSSHSDH